MEEIKNKLKEYPIPALIYIVWTAFIVLYILVIPIRSCGHSGGEQVPMTLIAWILGPTFWGYFFLSIVTSFLDKKWFKTYWSINLIIFLLTGFVLFFIYVLN